MSDAMLLDARLISGRTVRIISKALSTPLDSPLVASPTVSSIPIQLIRPRAAPDRTIPLRRALIPVFRITLTSSLTARTRTFMLTMSRAGLLSGLALPVRTLIIL